MFKLFKRKRQDNSQVITIDENDFRELTSGKTLKKEVNGETVRIVIKDMTHEDMSSVICEHYYSQRWSM